MTQVTTYLDYAASAPMRPEAIEALQHALAIGANPSSVHASGRAARAAVEHARDRVAAFAGVGPDGVVFTSGATEANTMAVFSAAAAPGVRRLLIGALEHESVTRSALAAAASSGAASIMIPVGGDGVYDLDWLRDELARDEGRAFVAMTAASNETGVVQPIAEAAREVAERGGWLHVDAVQAAGRLLLDFNDLGATTMALSAHKLGGPQGVGALLHAPSAPLRPRAFGGGQERGLRAGTENVAGVAGFAAVAQSPDSGEARAEVEAAARRAERRLRAAGAVIVGEKAPRLENFVCLGVGDWPSALQVMALDLAGVHVSAGSACSSGKVTASRALERMGLGAVAAGSLRATSGWRTRPQDWDRFADVWLQAYARHGARRLVKEYA